MMTAERFKNMRWVIIGLCFLANAINFIDRANLAIAAPHIRAELALDPTTMGGHYECLLLDIRFVPNAGRMVYR